LIELTGFRTFRTIIPSGIGFVILEFADYMIENLSLFQTDDDSL
jgi:hypothetical protein